jgi:hypothetical protein
VSDHLLEVFVLPDDDKDDFSLYVAQEDGWPTLIGFLQRLQNAKVIDGWLLTEIRTRGPLFALDDLKRKYGDDLDAAESGYEDSPGGGGEDAGYRSAMRDAGRGAQVG